jgi:transcription elongation factor GreB
VSKAFTREDDAHTDEALPPYRPPWPEGARNYITPAGLAALRAERDALAAELASAGEAASAEARRRLAVLGVHLDAAEVVEAPSEASEARFGCAVELKDSGGHSRRYAIVGVDEVDGSRGRVSWMSPIARALSGRRIGDTITLRSPRGEEELEIVWIGAIAPVP